MPIPAPKNKSTTSPVTLSASTDLELWGGHECTINRVGETWFDQTPRSGHDLRLDDLALFAGVGMRSIRYPALWEAMAPGGGATREFAWTDERLPEMARLGLNPILTLCHHGSGPRSCSATCCRCPPRRPPRRSAARSPRPTPRCSGRGRRSARGRGGQAGACTS